MCRQVATGFGVGRRGFPMPCILDPATAVPMPHSDSIRFPGGDITLLRTTAPWGLTVNAFLLRSRGATALVDTGFISTTSELLEALSDSGFGPGDIEHVFYTHTHEDHMGGGVALGDTLGGEHVVWTGARPAIESYFAYFDALPRWCDWIRDVLPAGMVRDEFASMFERRPALPRPADQTLPRLRLVEFGETVSVGDLRFECIDARGHDPFHVAWLEREHGWLFSGDVLLPIPTPIIPPLRDELGTYRATLERLRAMDRVTWVIPGHGRPSSHFVPVVDRSRDHLSSLFERVRGHLDRATPFDPASLVEPCVRGQPTPGRTRKGFIELGRTLSQLAELEERMLAAPGPDRLWRRTGEIPGYDEYVAWGA